MGKVVWAGAALLFLIALGTVGVLGLQGALTQLLLAILLAYLFIPLVRMLERLRLRRKTATITIVALLLLIFLGTLAVLFVYLFREFRAFVGTLPANFALAMQKLQYVSDRLELGFRFDQQGLIPLIRDYLTKLSPDVAGTIAGYVRQMFASTTNIVISILNLYLLPVFFFHIVADYEELVETAQSMIPRPVLPAVTSFCRSADSIVRGYIRGQLILALIRALAYAIGLALLRLDFGFLLGILTGILSIIPFVGVSLGVACALVIVLATNAGLHAGIDVVVMFSAVAVVEELVLMPIFIEKKSGLGELTIMLGLMIGGNLFGLTGIFLAVPVAAICRVILLRLKEEYQSSSYYLGGLRSEPISPPAPDPNPVETPVPPVSE